MVLPLFPFPIPLQIIASCCLLLSGFAATAQETQRPPTPQSRPERPQWMRDPERVHDPSTIITIDGVRRSLCTGPGVSVVREDASGRWTREGRLFEEGKFPAWHEEKVPGNRGYLWAPDVIQMGDKFLVYYSVSTFGKNTSAIGLVVGSSLDPSAAAWKWEDRGPVVLSRSSDRFNAIDPAIYFDEASRSLWMTFGSFWDGIFLVELDATTGLRKDRDKAPIRLAWSQEIEAPFVHRRGDEFFLFVNWGKCCRGVESTYEIRVGRSRSIEGPFRDREGRALVEGGGTPVLATQGRWIGPGHASIVTRDGREWLVHHYYDREAGGRPRLGMVALAWDSDGWPVTEPRKL